MTKAERIKLKTEIKLVTALKTSIDDYTTFHKSFPITIQTIGTLAALSLVKGCLEIELMSLNRKLVGL